MHAGVQLFPGLPVLLKESFILLYLLFELSDPCLLLFDPSQVALTYVIMR
jgi:hypothetical protein